MGKHEATGAVCLVYHEGEGQCVHCTCGDYHKAAEFAKLQAQDSPSESKSRANKGLPRTLAKSKLRSK